METPRRCLHRRRIGLRARWGALLVLLLLASCEKIDVGEEPEAGDVQQTTPTQSGMGTHEAPLTVEQVINGEGVTTGICWVVGYAVGSTYRSMSNATFEAETTNKSNILLAAEPNCTSTEACIPVELSSSKMQQLVSLAYNPGRHRQAIMVQGQLGRYFGCNGIRNTQAAYWLPGGFYLDDDQDTQPTEWEEEEKSY